MEFELFNQDGNVYYLSESFTITVVKKKKWDVFCIYRKQHYCLSVFDLEMAKEICEIIQKDFLTHTEKIQKKIPYNQKGKFLHKVEKNEIERYDKYIEQKAIEKQIKLIEECNE